MTEIALAIIALLLLKGPGSAGDNGDEGDDGPDGNEPKGDDKNDGQQGLLDDPVAPASVCEGVPELTDDTLNELYVWAVDSLYDLKNRPTQVQIGDVVSDFEKTVEKAITEGKQPPSWVRWWVRSVFTFVFGVPKDPTDFCLIPEPWAGELFELEAEVAATAMELYS